MAPFTGTRYIEVMALTKGPGSSFCTGSKPVVLALLIIVNLLVHNKRTPFEVYNAVKSWPLIGLERVIWVTYGSKSALNLI